MDQDEIDRFGREIAMRAANRIAGDLHIPSGATTGRFSSEGPAFTKEDTVASFVETLRRIRELQSRAPIFTGRLSGMYDVHVSTLMDDLPEYYDEVVRFPAHPLVVWLAKWFRFDPWTEITVRRRRTGREAYLFGNTLVVSPGAMTIIQSPTV